MKSQNAFDAPSQSTTIYFDVSDLLLYLRAHNTLSGIQRVQCEILRNLLDVSCSQSICLVVLNRDGGLGTIWRNDPSKQLVTILLTQAAWSSPRRSAT